MFTLCLFGLHYTTFFSVLYPPCCGPTVRTAYQVRTGPCAIPDPDPVASARSFLSPV